MCGIFLQICPDDHPIKAIDAHQKELIYNRGPDSFKEFSCELGSKHIIGISSVLHLRGDSVTVQPLESSRYILQWNGEIFDYKQNESDNGDLLKRNDTILLFEKLKESRSSIRSVLSSINGPWSITVIDKEEQVVYFARDYFGRRSLLFSQKDDRFIVTSVACSEESSNLNLKWIEASSGVLYKLDLKTMNLAQEELEIGKYMISSLNCDVPFNDSDIEKVYVKEALVQLRKSVRKRILHSHTKKIGILFSGGVDSLLIAAVSASIIDEEKLHDLEIDLINVAFEQAGLMKSLKLKQVEQNYYESVPDRVGGRAAFAELGNLFPNVRMNFVALNISRFQYESEKDRVIELLQPNRTVMDLSLGIVLWFGSRSLVEDSKGFKILLLGMGADEQLGGYSRHLSAFRVDSWKGLLTEMQMDLDRLGHRNLGRDDRCLSDHGREARFPFLDEDFVQWLCDLPLRIKCDLTLPKGEGDKRIFRLMCCSLGFSEPVAFRPKKAMQFGAKSAKISSSDCKGHDIL